MKKVLATPLQGDVISAGKTLPRDARNLELLYETEEEIDNVF